jgi:acyl-coenzyme A synthetase/AMP-(fatty) acid ligase
MRATVHIPNLGPDDAAQVSRDRGGVNVTWRQATASPARLGFDRVGFDAPLWVLFSSGTTGLPKGIGTATAVSCSSTTNCPACAATLAGKPAAD